MTTPLDLLGSWRLERTVDDHLEGTVRHVAGSTTLTRIDDGRVRWDESGLMRWDGHEVPVSRTLFVEERPDGWFVTFEDGRDFHPWATGRTVEHPCTPDHYTGLVTVHPDAWSVEWTARGPRKDYSMISRLTRT